MKTKITQNIKSIILALILVAGIGVVSAYSTWTPPTATPPGNNVDRPLNVGTTAQAKNGSLTIGASTPASDTGSLYSLQVPNKAAFFKAINTQALTITTGAGAGKVLQSDANGLATWQDAETGTISAPAGIYIPSQAWMELDHASNYKDAGSYTIHVIVGSSAAFSVVTQASGPVGSFWDTSSNNDKLAGIACNPGWTISGCWESLSGSDNDLAPYLNGCITNDYQQYGHSIIMVMSCVRSN